MGQPIGCLLDRKTTSTTVVLAGRAINLLALSRAQGIDHGYLSRIMRGTRRPSIDMAERIAAGLGMGLEDFLQARRDRIIHLEAELLALRLQHSARVKAEDTEDIRRLRNSEIVPPRNPALRA